MFGYEIQEIYDKIYHGYCEDEEERLAVINFCMGNSNAAYSALKNEYPMTEKEKMRLKWKALRDPEVCASMIIEQAPFLTKEDYDIAWDIALESYQACVTLIKDYNIYSLDFGTRRQIIDTALLIREHIADILHHLNNDDTLYVLNRIEKLVDKNAILIKCVARYFSYFMKEVSNDVRKAAFNIVLKNEYRVYDLFKLNKFNNEELKTVLKIHGDYLFEYTQDKYAEAGITILMEYFKCAKGLATIKQENFLINKLKVKKNLNSIQEVINKVPLHEESIDKLNSLLLLGKLSK